MTDSKTEILSIVPALIEFLEEKKAEDILILDVSNLSYLADIFVILSGQSLLHLHSIQTQLTLFLEERGFEKRNPKNSFLESPWVLLDFGDIVMHLFLPEARKFYSLEKLWEQAPVLFPQGEKKHGLSPL